MDYGATSNANGGRRSNPRAKGEGDLEMKSLLIMRHAKSAYPADAPDDFHRPLSKRGLEDAPRMGRMLMECGPRPDAIMCSSAVRAVATARGVARAMDWPEDEIRQEEQLYQATVETCFQAIADTPDRVSTLLVIAHNTTTEEWVRAVCGALVRLPTAAVAAMELPMYTWADAARTRGRMQWLVTPRLVKKMG